MRRQTGIGWDRTTGVIDMDDEWWKKARKDIPGCAKFRYKPLKNVDGLKIMFGDITNDEADHWNPMSSNPIIPSSQDTPIDLDGVDVDNDDVGGYEVHDFPFEDSNCTVGGDDVQEVSPSIVNAKRRSRVPTDKGKKARTGTTLVIQEQVTKIAESASSFTSKKLSEITVEQVMDLVLECGAGYDTDEHYIATELFVKKDQREIFMTLPTNEIRFNCLRRKYNSKYGN